jgi:hydroxymethylbilane synthase
MCQAQIVQAKLEERWPERKFALRTIKAQADNNPELSLIAMGGEGVFVKELETALLNGDVDLAVHSLKDLPLGLSSGIRLAAVLEREDPRDALVSRDGRSFDALPEGARVGTSSLRRRSQLLRRRQDLALLDIRGNVDTRLRKLTEGHYDAIVVAACGLIRLGLEERITEYLSLDAMLPEPGQGALAIEARTDDRDTLEMLTALEDPQTRCCVEAERAFLDGLGGGCRVPIAAYASCRDGTLELQGAVIAADGSAEVRGNMAGPMTEPVTLGHRLAEDLASRGARELLAVRAG